MIVDGVPAKPPAARLRAGALLLVFASFLGVALLVYRPALEGPPISDDFGQLLNPWVVDATPANLLALIDPTSQATRSLRNWAPIRPLVNALQWRLHPQISVAYHTTNVVLHALASVLLVMLFVWLGVSPPGAVLGGALFLLHPAIVESVAWMCQIWSPLALIFSIAAIVLLRRRPTLATICFALAVLSKPMAVFALPTVAVLEWCRMPGRDAPAPAPAIRWRWIALWTALVALYCVAEVSAAAGSGAATLDPDPAVRVRTVIAIALRYLVMAATSWGVSAFQDPPRSLSWLDPWFLASLVVLAALAWRLGATLAARRTEAAGWVWALAAFAPVSQVFPFLFPMADRYLYFMLPGLLIATLLALESGLARVADPARRRLAAQAVAVLAICLCALFALRSNARARIWRSEEAVMLDSALHSPDGVTASVLRARRAASEGDVEGAIAPLRAARSRGWDYYDSLLTTPAFERVRSDPRFQELLRDFATDRVVKTQRTGRLTQLDLRDLSAAYELLDQRGEAIAALERGLALGGPIDAELRRRLAQLRRPAPAPR